MRKKLTAIVLAVLAFSMIAASAATLGGINTSSLGAETDIVVSCDPDGIDVDFTVALSGGEYKTSAVNISGIAAACAGQDISVTLLDGTGASLGSAGPSAVAATTHSASITASASAVKGIAVVIEG
jgi:hypothetical protein